LNAVTIALNAGQYDAVLQAKDLPAKQPFTEVIEAGRQEQGHLIALRESQKLTNRPAVLAGLEKLKQQVRDKAPFAELSQWARQQQPVTQQQPLTPPATNRSDNARQAELARLDAVLVLWEVYFGVDKKNARRILDPKTQKPAEYIRIDLGKDQLNKFVDALDNKIKKGYEDAGVFSDQLKDRIDKLRLKIQKHDDR